MLARPRIGRLHWGDPVLVDGWRARSAVVAWWVRVSGPWDVAVGSLFGLGKLVDRLRLVGYTEQEIMCWWVVLRRQA